MQDKDIIALYFARNEDAIGATAEKYGPYCYTVAHNIVAVHEDAEECVNDTYLAAWNTIPPTVPDILRLFLAKITRSKAINLWKMKKAKKRGADEVTLVLDELAECVSGGNDPADEVAAGELSDTIESFLRTLPQRDRQLFVRRYFFTEPVKAIAENAGLTESNVSVVLHRTRAKLKDHLAKEGYLT